MAQTEDIDLKDLVTDALEKNGSLAKIRALLRANVFLAFEEENANKKPNIPLDQILKLPEGIVALSLVHEFLEFLNLKNTLFVYKAETRQGKEYKYCGKNVLTDKLNISQCGQAKTPLLVNLIKNLNKVNPRKFYDQGDGGAANGINHKFRDDQNCTYIVHEDSSATSSMQSSTSQSENSSDEKNRLQLRLPLDNSDTDTSSDSARDKTRSEYVPNDKIVIRDESEEDNTSQQSSTGADQIKIEEQDEDHEPKLLKDNTMTFSQYQMRVLSENNDSDSTSYVELKPYNQLDEEMLNTTGLPIPENKIKRSEPHSLVDSGYKKQAKESKSDSASSATLSNATSIHSLNTDGMKKSDEKVTPDYSNDFTTSHNSKQKDDIILFSNSVLDKSANNLLTIDSPHQNSHSTRSSVSISDVADLIELSEANSPRNANQLLKLENKQTIERERIKTDTKLPSDDSGDYSESSIPSVSNLSLDFHSD